MPAARRTSPAICRISWRDKGKRPMHYKKGLSKTTADRLYARLRRDRNVTDVNMYCEPKDLYTRK